MNKKLKTMNTELLNALKEKAHTWAVDHGFYDEIKPDAFYLGLVMSEAGEAINADRKDLHAPVLRYPVAGVDAVGGARVPHLHRELQQIPAAIRDELPAAHQVP